MPPSSTIMDAYHYEYECEQVEDIDADLQEVDIADREYERPGSRLGFFGNSSEEFPQLPMPVPEPQSRRCHWTRSLFRKFASGSKTTPKKGRDLSLPSSSSLEQDEIMDIDPFSDDDSEDLSDEELELEDFDIDFAPNPEPIPFPRPKFTCLPSPLHEAVRPPSLRVAARHEYAHRGYSRHALNHVKWFWATREEGASCADAYGGVELAPSGPTTTTTTLPCSLTPIAIDPTVLEIATPLPPMSVHPRRGDLVSLRDPICVHMDRYFVGMPLWTISKALWMFDVHVSLAAREDEDEDADRESCASDETLVESGSDGESLAIQGSPRKSLKAGRFASHDSDEKSKGPWETSWYKRTELLLQLTRQLGET